MLIATTPHGEIALTEYAGSVDRLLFVREKMEQIAQKFDGKLDHILPTTEGELYCSDYEGQNYIAKQYLDGFECNVLQERQQHYITRYAQNVDLLNPDASTSFLGTVQGMKYQGKSETEARNMAAISTKGRIQVQATLSALKEMAGWTIYGGLICMIFVLVVPYPKRKLLT